MIMLGVTEALYPSVLRVFAGLPSGALIDNQFFRTPHTWKIRVNFLFNHRAAMKNLQTRIHELQQQLKDLAFVSLYVNGDQTSSMLHHRIADQLDEILKATAPASPSPNTSELLGAKRGTMGTQVPAEATEEMCDSVRYLLIGMEKPGQTFGGIRQHCEWSGMDTSSWPDWIRGRDVEHFNKSARAALIWHCMYQSATHATNC